MTSAETLLNSELSLAGLSTMGAGNPCDREPIHLSGAVQSHGCLVAVDTKSLVVVAASANVATFTGCVTDPLGRPMREVLGDAVERAVRAVRATSNPHDSLPERVRLAGTGRTVDMVVHLQNPVLVVELEEGVDVGPIELAQYFHSHRNAGKVLLGLDSVEDICRLTAHEVRKLTGYDRVMVYRFEPDAHGYVLAEDRRADLEPFLGLHYPAGDIPRQARALYLRNWIRVIEDIDYTPVPVEAVPGALPGDQLDLSLSVLRSVSPLHLEYLRNMGVAATMTISLIVDDRLWGMVACHHGAPKRIEHVKRVACESLGHLVSVRLRAAMRTSYDQHVRDLLKMTSQVITSMAAGETPAIGAAVAAEPLLKMTAADGAVVEIDGIRTTVGSVPSDELLDRMVHRLAELAAGTRPFATESLQEHLSDADREDVAASGAATGALYLPLPGRVRGYVLWLRGERSQTLRWAGRPQDQDQDAAGGIVPQLSPRTSFDEWIEQVQGRSLPWDPADLAAATELAQAMPEVVEHRAQNRLVRMALHDPLTGLPNRTLLQDRLDDLLKARTGAAADDHCGVLFVDIDEFKAVNDTHGHQIGDELLILTAQRISSAVRTHDMVGRMAGDEFVVLLPETDAVEAASVGHLVVEELHRPFVLGGRLHTTVSASVGVAVVPTGTSPSEALRQADAAMYYAKKSGRNQAAVYDFTLGAVSTRQEIVRDELKRAIDGGQIVVYYQPVHDITPTDGPVLSGFEALARWHHPTRGVIPPDRFIGLAEETGLIDALGNSVMLQALRELRTWADRRLDVAVNVSVQELVRPGFAEDVLSRLTELGIESHRLTLEVTESQMMSQPELALAALAALDANGVKVAIDDFGTGFSSMAYLRDLPATVLKIDRMFIAGLPGNRKDVAVVRSIIGLAHSLGMRTVAEGVETPEQLTFLHEAGSDLAQGYLLGRPAPADHLGGC